MELSREERRRKEREAQRFYILPGQGRGAKKRRRKVRRRAIFTGLLLAALLGTALWLYHNREWL
ncbi:MAG: hypothetical protein M0Q48_05960 [Verrucomicrobia bacterium]|jgi:hypothetical protein|nr:hypothetical protein [Verrucomicrobiota bacterium]NCC60754.1 hypothetical protein [Verrucomicrobiae bacterium]